MRFVERSIFTSNSKSSYHQGITGKRDQSDGGVELIHSVSNSTTSCTRVAFGEKRRQFSRKKKERVVGLCCQI